MFYRSTPLEGAVWDKMMRGLSTRNYGAVVKEFRDAYGIEKSAVSDNFIEARAFSRFVYSPSRARQ